MPGGKTAQQGAAAAQLETKRGYDLVEIDGSAPERPARLFFADGAKFAVCTRCLCGTGVMTGRYPALGLRPTSGSPTLKCRQGTAAFDADARVMSRFFEMTRAEIAGGRVALSRPGGTGMVFRLGPVSIGQPGNPNAGMIPD